MTDIQARGAAWGWMQPRLMVLLMAVAAIPAVFPALDLYIAGLLYGPNAVLHAGDWFWVVWLNRHVPTIGRSLFIGGLILAVLLTVFRHRLPFAHRPVVKVSLFVSLGMMLGPGLAVLKIKGLWERARPREVLEFGGTQQFTPAMQWAQQCTDNCSFVSGHVATGFFLATLFVLGGRWRWVFLVSGIVLGLMVGFGRMAVGAHWLSDVLWAFPLTLIVSSLWWWALQKLDPSTREPALNQSA